MLLIRTSFIYHMCHCNIGNWSVVK